MSVHLVCSDVTSDWIIARLARHLMHHNGWGAGTKPSAAAGLNIYFPYVFYKPDAHPKRTLSAAFMTHREPGAKARMWQRAAEGLDLRVCMAERYAQELQEYGATVAVPVCYEVDQFTPQPRPGHKRPRVGLGGTVYRGGRKGESLALALYKANRERWDIVASGKPMPNATAWPIPSKAYPWREMPAYYAGLDVYVSTSTIEGGPVTVLEALGCGRPVVIGEGVGIESELPREPGIERYRVGDLASLTQAVERALACRTGSDDLAALVRERTPKAWARGWREAVLEREAVR